MSREMAKLDKNRQPYLDAILARKSPARPAPQSEPSVPRKMLTDVGPCAHTGWNS